VANLQLFSSALKLSVAIQIASDWFESQEKERSIQVYMSTFDTGIEPIRGELNSYTNLTLISTGVHQHVA